MDVVTVDLADPDHRLGPDPELLGDETEVLRDRGGLVPAALPRFSSPYGDWLAPPKRSVKAKRDILENLVITEHAPEGYPGDSRYFGRRGYSGSLGCRDRRRRCRACGAGAGGRRLRLRELLGPCVGQDCVGRRGGRRRRLVTGWCAVRTGSPACGRAEWVVPEPGRPWSVFGTGTVSSVGVPAGGCV